MTKRLDDVIVEEFRGTDFGDARLNRRLLKMVKAMAARPDDSFPHLFPGDAELEASYRFFNNDSVTADGILEPHIRQTVSRCRDRAVIAAHDTTVFCYAAGSKRRGLGAHRGTQEFRAHVTVAVSADETRDPLGVLACDTFVRRGDGGDGSEGRRWFRQADAVSKLDDLDPAQVIHVMDREADDFRTFVDLKERGHRFVVRCASLDRLLDNVEDTPMRLREALAHIQVQTTRHVPITSRRAHGHTKANQRKSFAQRNARLATLNVGAVEVTITRPKKPRSTLPSTCTLHIVRIWEPTPPPGEAPVEWVLATMEPIDTESAVLAVVDAYRARWRIEEFFKALKTGCAFEERQLESYEALTNALAISLPIAWRILRLRSLAQDAPSAPASTILDGDELAVLRARFPRKLAAKPTRLEALMAIARLGGHLRHNGTPGWQTLRKGLERLLTLVEGYRLAKKSRRRAICDQS
jgi:hypothetical protein